MADYKELIKALNDFVRWYFLLQGHTGWKIFIFFFPVGFVAFSILPLMPRSSDAFSSAPLAVEDGRAAVWMFAPLIAAFSEEAEEGAAAEEPAAETVSALDLAASALVDRMDVAGRTSWFFFAVQLGQM